MPTHLFIDTNIYLSFYHFSNDDLEELHKLAQLLAGTTVRLLLPEQVIDEFNRNRANRIADSLRQLREQKLKLRFPNICKEYEEYERLRTLQQDYENVHRDLLEKLGQDVRDHDLKADHVISDLFGAASEVDTTSAATSLASQRSELGNPPGKAGSLGDALNWEVLLTEVDDGEDLHFITDDKDYSSPIDRGRFNEFLLQEWHKKKNSSLVYYSRLSEFFKANYPDIELVDEADAEKDWLIARLHSSSSFAETHEIIEELSEWNNFSGSHLNNILRAVTTNDQVYWIIGDQDIDEFLESVLEEREDEVDEDLLEALRVCQEMN